MQILNWNKLICFVVGFVMAHNRWTVMRWPFVHFIYKIRCSLCLSLFSFSTLKWLYDFSNCPMFNHRKWPFGFVAVSAIAEKSSHWMRIMNVWPLAIVWASDKLKSRPMSGRGACEMFNNEVVSVAMLPLPLHHYIRTNPFYDGYKSKTPRRELAELSCNLFSLFTNYSGGDTKKKRKSEQRSSVLITERARTKYKPSTFISRFAISERIMCSALPPMMILISVQAQFSVSRIRFDEEHKKAKSQKLKKNYILLCAHYSRSHLAGTIFPAQQ